MMTAEASSHSFPTRTPRLPLNGEGTHLGTSETLWTALPGGIMGHGGRHESRSDTDKDEGGEARRPGRLEIHGLSWALPLVHSRPRDDRSCVLQVSVRDVLKVAARWRGRERRRRGRLGCIAVVDGRGFIAAVEETASDALEIRGRCEQH